MASTCGEQEQLIWKSFSIVLQRFFLFCFFILIVSYCLLSLLVGQTGQLASRHCAFFLNLSSENPNLGLHAFATSSLSTEMLSQFQTLSVHSLKALLPHMKKTNM